MYVWIIYHHNIHASSHLLYSLLSSPPCAHSQVSLEISICFDLGPEGPPGFITGEVDPSMLFDTCVLTFEASWYPGRHQTELSVEIDIIVFGVTLEWTTATDDPPCYLCK